MIKYFVMELKIKKIHPDAKLPKYATEGDAGMDLFATEEKILGPGDFWAVPVGFALEIPKGYAGLIWDKSGLSINHGLKILGGVIDSGYRGEVKVGIINLSNSEYKIEKGHKVAQMIVQKIEHVEIIEVENLSETKRGEEGFGSTGK